MPSVVKTMQERYTRCNMGLQLFFTILISYGLEAINCSKSTFADLTARAQCDKGYCAKLLSPEH